MTYLVIYSRAGKWLLFILFSRLMTKKLVLVLLGSSYQDI